MNSFLKKINKQKKSRLLKETQNEEFPYFVSVFDYKLVVLKNVFSPKYYFDWRFFIPKFPDVKNKTCLEVGCGSGVISIFMAKKEAAKVVSVDINPDAVRNTKINAILNKVDLDVRFSDVFSGLKDNEEFDIIFWNIPWYNLDKNYEFSNVLERAIFDPNYKILKKFLRGSKNYLSEKGKILLGLGNVANPNKICDVDKINDLIKAFGYKKRMIAKGSLQGRELVYQLNELSPKF